MNFVQYIRENGLVGTDLKLINGRNVRIVSIDYDPAGDRPILGYDVITLTTMAWNRYGMHLTEALSLVKPAETFWLVTYPDETPAAYYEKITAIDIARFNNQTGLGPSEVHEITLSNETKVKL